MSTTRTCKLNLALDRLNNTELATRQSMVVLVDPVYGDQVYTCYREAQTEVGGALEDGFWNENGEQFSA